MQGAWYNLVIDMDCNQQSMEYFYKYYEQFSLYRISIYSLNNEKNNHFFTSNYLEVINDFVTHENVKKSGEVLIIPITKENINELPSIALFGSENDFKVNPLILPDNRLIPFSNILTNKEYNSCINTIKELLNIYGGNIYLDIPSGFDIIGKQAIRSGFRYSADICSDEGIRLCEFSRNRYYIDINQLDGFWAQYDESKYMGNKCINCKKYMMCGGGCLASAENNNRKITKKRIIIIIQ